MYIWRTSICMYKVFVIICWIYTQGAVYSCQNKEQHTSGECYFSPTCRGFKYDPHKNSCCNDQIFEGAELRCCGEKPYNAMEDSCCNGNLTKGLSKLVSRCCGSVAYNPLNELCCKSRVFPRQAHSECCNAGVYDATKQLCCGQGTILLKTDKHSVCCGNETFNYTTHCCTLDATVRIRNASDPPPTKDGICKEPENNSPSGNESMKVSCMSCGNASKSQNCVEDPTKDFLCCPDTPLGYICCNGRLHNISQEKTHCCGQDLYHPALRENLCCNGKLHYNVPEGSRCMGKSIYNPNNETICENKIYPKVHGQCCGKNLFDPEKELCCNGYSYPREPEMICCGTQSYNLSDSTQKCCSGQLHKLSCLTKKAECCGTQLIKNNTMQQCCRSSQLELIYNSQPDFSCCGYRYYNASEFLCCAEIVYSRHTYNVNTSSCSAGHVRHCTPLNLKRLCSRSRSKPGDAVKIGTLEAAWQEKNHRRIRLTNVFVVQQNKFAVEPEALISVDHCSCPELVIGRQYLWSEARDNKKSLWYPTQEFQGSLLHILLSACE